MHDLNLRGVDEMISLFDRNKNEKFYKDTIKKMLRSLHETYKNIYQKNSGMDELLKTINEIDDPNLRQRMLERTKARYNVTDKERQDLFTPKESLKIMLKHANMLEIGRDHAISLITKHITEDHPNNENFKNIMLKELSAIKAETKEEKSLKPS